MPHRIARHLRANIVAYLALGVAVAGGGGYALAANRSTATHVCADRGGAHLLHLQARCHRGQQALSWVQTDVPVSQAALWAHIDSAGHLVDGGGLCCATPRDRYLRDRRERHVFAGVQLTGRERRRQQPAVPAERICRSSSRSVSASHGSVYNQGGSQNVRCLHGRGREWIVYGQPTATSTFRTSASAPGGRHQQCAANLVTITERQGRGHCPYGGRCRAVRRSRSERRTADAGHQHRRQRLWAHDPVQRLAVAVFNSLRRGTAVGGISREDVDGCDRHYRRPDGSALPAVGAGRHARRVPDHRARGNHHQPRNPRASDPSITSTPGRVGGEPRIGTEATSRCTATRP